jgi:hypothetical protein
MTGLVHYLSLVSTRLTLERVTGHFLPTSSTLWQVDNKADGTRSFGITSMYSHRTRVSNRDSSIGEDIRHMSILAVPLSSLLELSPCLHAHRWERDIPRWRRR